LGGGGWRGVSRLDRLDLLPPRPVTASSAGGPESAASEAFDRVAIVAPL